MGVFIGLSPLWGFQTIIVLFLALLFRLNKFISFSFSNISFPPLIPFVILISFKVGDLFFGTETNYSIDSIKENFQLTNHLKTYLVGSVIFSTLAAFAFGLLGYLVFSISDKKNTDV